MSYSTSGKIQASDFNWFVDANGGNPENFNKLWATGTGTYGYGQTAIPTVTFGQKFTAANTSGGSGVTQTAADYGGWAALADGITKLAAHTGASVTATPVPVPKNKAQYLSQIATNLTALHNARLNATDQGGTFGYTVGTATSWKNKVDFNFTVDFGSHDKARWFFNSGGQIKVNSDHPTGPNINILVRALAQSIGEIWISGTSSQTLGTTTWAGITKVGGTDPSLVLVDNSTYGFSSWTSTPTTLFKQTTAGGTNGYYHGYGTNSFIEVIGWTDGAGKVYVTVRLDEIPLRGTPQVSGPGITITGTTATILLKNPSTTYLTNNWGNPTPTVDSVEDTSDN